MKLLNNVKRCAVTLLVTLGISMGSYGAKVIEGGFYKSGNQLIENCDDESVYGRTACLNYILGIAEAHTTLKAWGEANVMCIPETVTGGQLMAVSLKYMRSVPEILHLGAGSHVLNALLVAFPCRD